MFGESLVLGVGLHSEVDGYSATCVSTDNTPDNGATKANGHADDGGADPTEEVGGDTAAGADQAKNPEEPQEAADPLAEAEQKVASLKDQLLRTAADFDNYRKRSRREVDEARSGGRDGMLKDLLPVFDNLERAAEAAVGASDVKSLVSGIEMVIKQFRDTLGRLGIERLKSLGEPFDPNLHEAIQQLETTEFAPGAVAGEVQGGYRQGDRLIRPAMVVVAKAPASDGADPTAQDEQSAEGTTGVDPATES